MPNFSFSVLMNSDFVDFAFVSDAFMNHFHNTNLVDLSVTHNAKFGVSLLSVISPHLVDDRQRMAFQESLNKTTTISDVEYFTNTMRDGTVGVPYHFFLQVFEYPSSNDDSQLKTIEHVLSFETISFPKQSYSIQVGKLGENVGYVFYSSVFKNTDRVLKRVNNHIFPNKVITTISE